MRSVGHSHTFYGREFTEEDRNYLVDLVRSEILVLGLVPVERSLVINLESDDETYVEDNMMGQTMVNYTIRRWEMTAIMDGEAPDV